MATKREIRSDIILVASRIISKDSPISERHVDFLIDKYRASEIERDHSKFREIDPTWLQDLGMFKTTQSNSANDPRIQCTSVNFAKVRLPSLVKLWDDEAFYRASSSSKLDTYYRQNPNFIWEILDDPLRRGNKYSFRMGNDAFLYPYVPEASFVCILGEPLKGWFYDNTIQTELIVGESYTVTKGNVTHSGTTYYTGDTFLAVSTIFTGTGEFAFTNSRRRMRVTDPYPCSMDMAQAIVIRILTGEFQIEKKQIVDVRNDAAAQLAVLQATPVND